MSSLNNIKAMLAKQLNIGVDTIKDSARLVEDLGADSLDMIEMLMSLEEQFGINVPDDKAAGLKTVADIAAFIDSVVKK